MIPYFLMHAFLVIGNSESFLANLPGKKMEVSIAKVADVRELSNFTKLKVTEETVIVIRDFDIATEETQNAFLKALEEPQTGLSYVLTARNIQNILPTIVSRCQVVEVKSEKLEVTNEDKEKIEKFIKSQTGGKLAIIAKINKREDAIEFIKKLIIVAHESFLENAQPQLLDNANKTLRNLEANGNVQLQLTNFVINTA